MNALACNWKFSPALLSLTLHIFQTDSILDFGITLECLFDLRSHLFTLFIHLKTHPKWKSRIPDIIFLKSRKVQKLPEPAVL